MHKVELYISSSADLLPLLHLICVWHVLPSVDDGQVGRQEGRQTILNEGEELFLVLLRLIQVVEEDATYTSCLTSVLVAEVLIAPLFESWVVCLIVLIASLFDSAVEVYSVFVVEVGGCEVAATAVPPCICVSGLVGSLEVSVVEVYGRCVGVVRVKDHGQASGEELERIDIGVKGFVVDAHLLYGRFW